MTNRTFVMCKPDAVERGLIGEIVGRIERKGLRIVAAELRSVDRDLAEEHYDEHRDKPFYGELVDFLSRSPVFAMIVEGPERRHLGAVPHPDRHDEGDRRAARLDSWRPRHDDHREPRPRQRRARVRGA